MTKKRTTYVSLGAASVLILLILLFTGGDADAESEIIVDVESGLFRVDINTTGELQARNFTSISGPRQLRRYRIYQVTIQDIIIS